MKEFLDLGDNVIDTNLKIDNLGRKIYKKPRKKRSHQLSISTYGNMVSCESRKQFMNIRQLKRLIKEAIGDNESITAEYNNPISLLSNFKTTKFENFIVDYSKHFMELENDTKRVSIKIPDEYTLEFQFYDYEFSEDPITVVEAKYAHPTRESGRMNLHTTYTNDEIESAPWIPDGTALESRIEQLVYDFLTS